MTGPPYKPLDQRVLVREVIAEHLELRAVDPLDEALYDTLVIIEERDPSQRVCGKPRSTCDVAGSGHREVTTLPRV